MSEPTIIAGTIPEDITESLEQNQYHDYLMNQPVTFWKLIEVLKAFGVIEKDIPTQAILEKIQDNL